MSRLLWLSSSIKIHRCWIVKNKIHSYVVSKHGKEMLQMQPKHLSRVWHGIYIHFTQWSQRSDIANKVLLTRDFECFYSIISSLFLNELASLELFLPSWFGCHLPYFYVWIGNVFSMEHTMNISHCMSHPFYQA